MRVKSFRIECNDDETYQVTAYGGSEFGCCGGKEKTYSAKNKSDIMSKIEEAEKAFSEMKEPKKKDDMKEFLNVGKSEYEDE